MKKRLTKKLPTAEQVAKWRRTKLVDEYCYSANHGRDLANGLQYLIEKYGLKDALPHFNALKTEFERLLLIAGEFNQRILGRDIGPRT